MAAVVERVDRLEEALQDFITNVGIEFKRWRLGWRAMGDLTMGLLSDLIAATEEYESIRGAVEIKSGWMISRSNER